MATAERNYSAVQPSLAQRFSALNQRIGNHAENAANLAAQLKTLRQESEILSAELINLATAEEAVSKNQAARHSVEVHITDAEDARTFDMVEGGARPKITKESIGETVADKIDDEQFEIIDHRGLLRVASDQEMPPETALPGEVHAMRPLGEQWRLRGTANLQDDHVARCSQSANGTTATEFSALLDKLDLEEDGEGPERLLSGRVFADPEDLKERIRANLHKVPYDVRDYYYESGIAQFIARSLVFDWVSLLMVTLNSIWISVDLDLNEADTLSDADLMFQVAAHLFCVFFCVELLIRFLAFKRKWNATTDFWFMFDLVMVLAIVLDTWVLNVIVALSNSNDSAANSRVFVVFRLFRLLRVVRVFRVMRSIPEVVIIVRGIGIALRAIFVVLLLICFIIYIAAILFRVILEGTAIGANRFSSIPACMGVLLLDGTLSGAKGVPLMYEASKESAFYSLLIFCFVLVANITCMGVLSGLLVQTVKTVAECEKEEKTVKTMQKALNHVWDLINAHDEDMDGLISHDELHSMLLDKHTDKLLQKMDVDIEGVASVAGFVFENEGGTLSKTAFKQMILDLRNKNVAKVKDVVETRKFIHQELKRAGLVGASNALGSSPSYMAQRAVSIGNAAEIQHVKLQSGGTANLENAVRTPPEILS